MLLSSKEAKVGSVHKLHRYLCILKYKNNSEVNLIEYNTKVYMEPRTRVLGNSDSNTSLKLLKNFY